MEFSSRLVGAPWRLEDFWGLIGGLSLASCVSFGRFGGKLDVKHDLGALRFFGRAVLRLIFGFLEFPNSRFGIFGFSSSPFKTYQLKFFSILRDFQMQTVGCGFERSIDRLE